MRDYVNLVSPWVNEWRESDFRDPKVQAYRTSPSHVIFNIPTRPLPGLLERFLLGQNRAAALDQLIAWVSRFNDANARFAGAGPLDRLDACIVLHAGVIGAWGTLGLFDVWCHTAETVGLGPRVGA
jgi:hypothetical protein